MKIIEEYEYVVFADEAGNIFVLRSCLINVCLFAGSVGKLREIEKGTWKVPECEKDNSSYYIGMLINKEKEYRKKMLKNNNEVTV